MAEISATCCLLLLVVLVGAASSSKFTTVNSLPGYNGILPFKLETGYIGVGDSEEIQLFYYFLEAERDPIRSPLFIWLTGGHCSAFSGLVFEVGPLQFNSTAFTSESDLPTFQINPYSWTQVASMIFIDTPVGVGFSYATSQEAYTGDDTQTANQIYEFLRKWLLDHPRFLRNPFYVGGDSYGGKVVPIVVHDILAGNQMGLEPNINLQVAKLSCGNYMPPKVDDTRCLVARRAVTEDVNGLEKEHFLQPRCVDLTSKPNGTSSKSNKHAGPILIDQRLQSTRQPCHKHKYPLSVIWANDVRVREALQIRKGTVGHWMRCNKTLPFRYDVPTSVVVYHQNFTSQDIRALVYSGDQDMLVPYIDTLRWIQKLDVPVDKDWRPWFVDGQVAGVCYRLLKLSL